MAIPSSWSSVPVSDLTAQEPFYIAHRGSGDEFPEHTLLAYESAVAAGARAIEVSVSSSADGFLVCFHDSTLDRLTTESGDIDTYQWSALRTLTVSDPALGPGWEPQRLTLLEEVLDRLAGRVVMFVEHKQPNTSRLTQLFDVLDSYNMETSVVFKCFKGEYANDAATRGYRVWAYLDSATSSDEIRELAGNRDITYLGVPYYDTGVSQSTSDEQITEVVSYGKPVIAWPIHRKSEVAHLSGLGVKGIMASGYKHLNTTPGPILTSDTFKLGVRAPGDLPRNYFGDFQPSWNTSEGSIILDTQWSPAYMLGSLSTDKPRDSYTIMWEMAVDEVPADTGKHADFVFGRVDDARYEPYQHTGTGGYHVVFRMSGDLELYKHDEDGNGTNIANTVSTAAPTAGGWMGFKVTVSPEQVTVERTDVSSDLVTASDTAYRGGYLHLVRNWDKPSDGGSLRFRNIQVS